MNTFDQSINAILLKLLLINKDIFSRFLNHVGRYGWIEQVVKNMFWHYKHFDQSMNVILLKLLL